MSTHGAVVLVDGTVVDWDDENFSELQQQVGNSQNVARFKDVVIDSDGYIEFRWRFNGSMSIRIHDGGYGITIQSSKCTFHSPIRNEE